jgi:hypothetical protein
LREGKKHTVYVNRAAQASSTVPRHREIKDFLASKICRDLQVPGPKAKNNLAADGALRLEASVML